MAKRKRTKGQKTICNTYTKTKDRATRTPLKTGGELRHPSLSSANVVVSIVLNYLMLLGLVVDFVHINRIVDHHSLNFRFMELVL
jgi:hypothetical protein